MRTGLLVCSLIAVFSASAQTIVSQTAAPMITGYYGSDIVSWTQTAAYSNASIAAYLARACFGGCTGPATGMAYLTTQVGPGTTTAQQIATTPISVSTNNAFSLVTLFSGLTLNPGTYYLLIVSDTTNLILGSPISGWILTWAGSDSAVITCGTGVTPGPALFGPLPPTGYPPSNTFTAISPPTRNLLFAATGTPVLPVAPVPALSTWAMLLTALLLGGSGLLLVRRYRPAAN